MRRVTLAVVPVLWIVSTTSGLAEDLADLIEQHVRGSDEARLKVIDAGVAAVPGLLNIMRTQEGVAAERAARALGWIAEFAPAAERRKTEWVLVNVLLDHEQPLLARKTAARSLWHVASEESVPVLAQFVEDPELGPEVLWSLQNMKGSRPLSALMDKMGSTKDTTRVAILTALGCRPDAPVSLFTEAAQDKAPAVRITALAALGKRPSGEVAHFLEKCINKSSSVEERLAAWRAYVAVGDGLTAAGQRDEARQVYLQALSKGAKVSDVVVRALSGLGKTGTAETAAMIGPFLDRSEPSIQVAAASALARLPGSQATQILVEELASAPLGKARPILSALAERADSTAVSAVIPFVRVSNLDVRLLALRALGRLGDSAACEVILEAYRDPAATDVLREAALEAYLEIGAAELGGGNSESARGIFESALQLAKTEAQKISALRRLASVASPQSLLALGPSLQTAGQVRDEAVAAYLACTATLVKQGKREAAVTAYTNLINVVPNGPQTGEIVRRLGKLGSSMDLGSRNGFVTHWWVIGPFPSDNNYGGTDEVFFPEQEIVLTEDHPWDNQRMAWRHQHSLDPQGIIDYLPLFDRKMNAVAYAYAEVTVAQPMEARLHAGSDDSLVVWVNGEEVHRFKGPRSLSIGQDKQDIKLRAGVNTILIKVVQGSGDWSSSIQLTDRSDHPLRFEQKTQ